MYASCFRCKHEDDELFWLLARFLSRFRFDAFYYLVFKTMTRLGQRSHISQTVYRNHRASKECNEAASWLFSPRFNVVILVQNTCQYNETTAICLCFWVLRQKRSQQISYWSPVICYREKYPLSVYFSESEKSCSDEDELFFKWEKPPAAKEHYQNCARRVELALA